MTAAAITLPRKFSTRDQARSLARNSIKPNTIDLALNAMAEFTTSPAAADELVKEIRDSQVERVVVANASESLRKHLKLAHDKRTRPENTFLILHQDISQDVLLRTA